MPFDDIQAETDSLDALSGQGDVMPTGQELGMQGEGMSAPGGQSPGQSPGGPGVDTPQEQQAVQLFMQGAQAFRQASTVEPSVRYIVDEMLQKAFLSITKHYGMEQEGKLALQQAQLGANKQKSANLTGPPAPPSFG